MKSDSLAFKVKGISQSGCKELKGKMRRPCLILVTQSQLNVIWKSAQRDWSRSRPWGFDRPCWGWSFTGGGKLWFREPESPPPQRDWVTPDSLVVLAVLTTAGCFSGLLQGTPEFW